MKKFLKQNRKFWSEFSIKNNGQKLLIEEPGWPMILHTNAVFAMIINQAKGHIPVWLGRKNSREHQLIRSYFPDIQIITTKKYLPRKLYAAMIAFLKYIKVLLSKDILGLHYDGIEYGDIVYDTYLSENKVATIKKNDFKLCKIIAKCVFRHIKIKNILQNEDYAGVLVSHQQGISSGVMLRCALHYGYQGYLHTGHHQSTLQRFKSLEEIISNPHKPFQSDIRRIINQLGPELNKVFLKIFKQEIAGKGSADGLRAFSKNNKRYANRTSFNKDYKLVLGKKNVFIMLHPFNEQPHSHSRRMIFKDYYDWFIQTLEFAKKNNKVNWIFKQHPSYKYYATDDVDLDKLFSKCPDNIIYIDEDRQIDTRSLIHCADLIVTCLGSAGFMLPAIGAIPSVTAGSSFYTNLGFTVEPKTRKEYFEVLNNVHKIKKLSIEAQNRARAAYIYIYKISRVNLSACPTLSSSQTKDKTIKNWYWDEALKQYTDKKNIIFKEINHYIQAVKKPGFRKLISKI